MDFYMGQGVIGKPDLPNEWKGDAEIKAEQKRERRRLRNIRVAIGGSARKTKASKKSGRL